MRPKSYRTDTLGVRRPGNPGDDRDCNQFATQRDAQAYFDYYYPYYGDVSRLDRDNDRIACELTAAEPQRPR